MDVTNILIIGLIAIITVAYICLGTESHDIQDDLEEIKELLKELRKENKEDETN